MRWIAVIGLMWLCYIEGLAQDSSMYYTYGTKLQEGFTDIIFDGENYYAIGNSTNQINNSSDVYLVKLDTNFQIVWSKYYDIGGDERGQKIIKTIDENLVLLANTNVNYNSSYDIYILNLDTSGNIIWDNYYGGADWDLGNDLVENNNGFLIVGETFSFGNGDLDGYLLQLGFNGELLMDSTFGGIKSDKFSSIIKTQNGYVIAGSTTEENSDSLSATILNLSPTLDLIFLKMYGGLNDDHFNSIAQTTDLGYIAVGYSQSYGYGDKDIYYVKVDNNGNQIYDQVLGINTTGDNKDDEAMHVVATSNNEYLVTGYTKTFGIGEGDIFGTLAESSGISKSTSSTYGAYENEIGFKILPYKNEGFLVAGFTESYGQGKSDAIIVRRDSTKSSLGTIKLQTNYLDTSFTSLTQIEQISLENNLINLYPNPVHNLLNIEFSNLSVEPKRIDIYNSLGQLINSQNISRSIDCNFLNKGIYYLRFFDRSNGLIQTNKIVIE